MPGPWFRALALILVVSIVAAGNALAVELQTPALAPPKIGEKVANATFKDIRYLPRSLSELVSPDDKVETRAIVLVFTNTTCPLVQRYLPKLKQFDKEFGPKGVKLVAVNVGPTDSVVDLATQAVEYDIPFACVKDIDGSVVAATGVKRTPEVVVLDARLHLKYRGRIDDQYRLGGARPKATRHYLREAIAAVLAGDDVATAETPVDGCYITGQAKKATDQAITFHADVRPIIAKNCQYCHQNGTTAPFSLISYDDVAGNGEMIAEVVAEQRMPPWYASSKHGEFMNDRTLSRGDRETIVAWVRAGMPEGKQVATNEEPTKLRNDSPQDPEWGDQRWWLGKPDMILTVPGTYDVPADGFVDYRYAVLPKVFLSDTWIAAAEVQPDNPRVVHHANLGFLPLGTDPRRSKLITGYVPGVGPMELDDGVASKVPAGSVMGLQIHLTTTGKPEKTRLRVGLRFPRYKVEKQLHYVQLSNTRFAIKPFASHHPVTRTKQINSPVTLYGFFTHMHLRGKDSTFYAHLPGGETQTLLMVPNYNFDWQLPYYLKYGDVKLPAGTKFECRSHFDNSTFNPYNPDPSITVRDGEQTIQEMMYGFVFFTKDDEQLNLEIDPNAGTAKSPSLLKGLFGSRDSGSKKSAKE